MRIVWSWRSLSQKDAIWAFLADRSPDYADRVETRIEERAKSLGLVPRQGRPIGDGNRQLSIPDIQYVIEYFIDEDAVRILRVRSTAQDEDE